MTTTAIAKDVNKYSAVNSISLKSLSCENYRF